LLRSLPSTVSSWDFTAKGGNLTAQIATFSVNFRETDSQAGSQVGICESSEKKEK
jgi:hypothetical protein